MATFRDLQVGDTFDFDSGRLGYVSFFDRCIKTSTRKYQTLERPQDFPEGMEVGTINVNIFNIKRAN